MKFTVILPIVVCVCVGNKVDQNVFPENVGVKVIKKTKDFTLFLTKHLLELCKSRNISFIFYFKIFKIFLGVCGTF